MPHHFRHFRSRQAIGTGMGKPLLQCPRLYSSTAATALAPAPLVYGSEGSGLLMCKPDGLTRDNMEGEQ